MPKETLKLHINNNKNKNVLYLVMAQIKSDI